MFVENFLVYSSSEILTKIKVMRTLFLSLLCLFGALTILQAQDSSYGVAYQAVARDADGDPLADTELAVRVTLKDGATTVWQEEHASVLTNQFGNLALTIGSGVTSAGTSLADVDWSAAGLHFEIEVDAGTGTYASFGDVAVQAVPVAMYALNGQEEEIAALWNALGEHEGDFNAFVTATNNTLSDLQGQITGNADQGAALLGMIQDAEGDISLLQIAVNQNTADLADIFANMTVNADGSMTFNDIDVQDLTVNGQLDIPGAFSAATGLFNYLSAGNADFEEALIQNLDAENLTFSSAHGVGPTSTLELDGSLTVDGASTFNGTVSVPTPTAASDAATKGYVDAGDAAEATARQNADTQLQSNIDAEATARQNADTQLQANIDAEATTRGNADTQLQSNIDAEATARGNADANLQGQIDSNDGDIDQLNQDLAAEATTRGNADTQLQSNIDAEATARGNADTQLQGNIDAEATARQNADNALQSDIDDNGYRIANAAAASGFVSGEFNGVSSVPTHPGYTGTNHLDNESTLIDADVALDGAIAAEASRALAAEGLLDGEIEANATAIQTNANNLQSEITRATNREDQIESDASAARGVIAGNLAQEITDRQAADTQLQSNIDAEEGRAIAAEGVLQGNIEAEEAARIDDVNAEEARAMAAEGVLQGNIDAEASARSSADAGLQGQIDSNDGDIAQLNTDLGAEVSRATAAEGDLQGQITGNDTDITNLQLSLSNEVAARQFGDAANNNAIGANSNAIANEVAAREAGDAALQAQIDDLSLVTDGATTATWTEIIETSEYFQNSGNTVQMEAPYTGMSMSSLNASTIESNEVDAQNADIDNLDVQNLNVAVDLYSPDGTIDDLNATQISVYGDVQIDENLNVDGTASFTGAISVPTPVAGTDAATKAYVDAGDANLQSQIDGNDGDIATLTTNLATEASTRAAADTDLQSNIDAEASARSTADAGLQTQIDGNDSDIATLTTNLATEVIDRTTAVSGVQSAIEAEETRAMAAEAGLQGQITSNDGDISNLTMSLANEVAARQFGDAANNNAISANTVAIANESSTRAAADAALADEDDLLWDAINSVPGSVFEVEQIVESLDYFNNTGSTVTLESPYNALNVGTLFSSTANFNSMSSQDGDIDNLTTQNLNVTDDLYSPDGTIDIFDATHIDVHEDLEVDGFSFLDNTEVDGTLNVTGTLNVDGETTLGDNTSIDGNLSVTGTGSFGGTVTAADATAMTHLASFGQLNTAADSLQENIIDEMNRAMNREAELQSELDATQTGAGLAANGAYNGNTGTSYIDGATSLDSADDLLDAALKSEETARIGADIAISDSLQQNIVDEMNRAMTREGELQAEIDAEELARAAADVQISDSLQQNIVDEMNRAMTAEGVLQTNINNEETARINSDNAISDSLQQNIVDEMNRAMTAEGVLQTNINNEATARINADIAISDSLQANINDEVLRATTREGELQNELDATQTGAGLDADGSYIANGGANYMSAASSLADADDILDAALKAEETRAITREDSIIDVLYWNKSTFGIAVQEEQVTLDPSITRVNNLAVDYRVRSLFAANNISADQGTFDVVDADEAEIDELTTFEIFNYGRITTDELHWTAGRAVGANSTTWLEGTLDVDGVTTLNDSLDVDGNAVFHSNAQVDLNLNVDGITTVDSLNAADGVYFESTLEVDGATALNSTLDVDGVTTLNDSLDVDGNAVFHSNVWVDDNLDVDGVTTVDSLNASLGVAFDSTLDVDGVTTLNDSLDVDGGAAFHSDVQMDQNLNVTGDITVDDVTGDSLDFNYAMLDKIATDTIVNVSSDGLVILSDDDIHLSSDSISAEFENLTLTGKVEGDESGMVGLEMESSPDSPENRYDARLFVENALSYSAIEMDVDDDEDDADIEIVAQAINNNIEYGRARVYAESEGDHADVGMSLAAENYDLNNYDYADLQLDIDSDNGFGEAYLELQDDYNVVAGFRFEREDWDDAYDLTMHTEFGDADIWAGNSLELSGNAVASITGDSDYITLGDTVNQFYFLNDDGEDFLHIYGDYNVAIEADGAAGLELSYEDNVALLYGDSVLIDGRFVVRDDADFYSSVHVDGNTDVDGDFDVDGITTVDSLNASLGVDFESTLHVDGNTDVDGDFDVDGVTTVDSLNAAEGVYFESTLEVDGHTALDSTLTVDDFAQFNDTVSVAKHLVVETPTLPAGTSAGIIDEPEFAVKNAGGDYIVQVDGHNDIMTVQNLTVTDQAYWTGNMEVTGDISGDNIISTSGMFAGNTNYGYNWPSDGTDFNMLTRRDYVDYHRINQTDVPQAWSYDADLIASATTDYYAEAVYYMNGNVVLYADSVSQWDKNYRFTIKGSNFDQFRDSDGSLVADDEVLLRLWAENNYVDLNATRQDAETLTFQLGYNDINNIVACTDGVVRPTVALGTEDGGYFMTGLHLFLDIVAPAPTED